MKKTREVTVRKVIGFVVLMLAVAACGDDGSGNPLIPATSTTTQAPATTAAPSTTTTQAATTTGAIGEDPDLPPGTAYSSYDLITNGTVEVQVPVEWDDVYDGVYIFDGREVGVALAASTNQDRLVNGFDAPGVFIATTTDPSVTADAIFAVKDFTGLCTYDGRDAYDDGEYEGEFETWLDCDGLLSDFIVIVATPYGGGPLVTVEVTLVTDADFEALQTVLASWRLVG